MCEISLDSLTLRLSNNCNGPNAEPNSLNLNKSPPSEYQTRSVAGNRGCMPRGERAWVYAKYTNTRDEQSYYPVHLWTWLSWRGKSKLPNEHPLEHCVRQ